MFPETVVLDKVMKSQKMSDEARERREEPTMGSRINKKGFYQDFRVPEIMDVTQMTSVGVKAEYTDCKNLDPRKKSVNTENNQTT